MTANDQIVATATDAAGNTSEFSFTEATLAIQTVTPSLCGAEDGVFCDGYESEARASLKVVVHAAAALPPFAPNGRVLITDNRGHSCSARLSPTETALVSSGECILVGAGAAGSITITAVLDAFGSAFASASGGNPSTNTQIVVP